MEDKSIFVDAYGMVTELTDTYLKRHIPLPEDKVKDVMGIYTKLMNYPMDDETEDTVLNFIKLIDTMLKADDELKALISEQEKIAFIFASRTTLPIGASQKMPPNPKGTTLPIGASRKMPANPKGRTS